MASEWMDTALFESGQFAVSDAMGVFIDHIESARETTDGVEAIALACTPEGDELVCSHDGGVTFDPVRARMEIPGGMILDLRDDED